MKQTCTGIILSGGRNSRMQGINKSLLEIGGIRFIERVINTLNDLFDEILIVTKEPRLYEQFNLKIIEDILNIYSPLSGIHAGLANITTDYAFCIGCDTPFLEKKVVDILTSAIEPEVDVIVPFSGIHYQPLCAIYSKRCIPLIEAQLIAGDYKVDNLFAKINVRTISYKRLELVDSKLLSFFNVNSPADLKAAKRLQAERMKHMEKDRNKR